MKIFYYGMIYLSCIGKYNFQPCIFAYRHLQSMLVVGLDKVNLPLLVMFVTGMWGDPLLPNLVTCERINKQFSLYMTKWPILLFLISGLVMCWSTPSK